MAQQDAGMPATTAAPTTDVTGLSLGIQAVIKALNGTYGPGTGESVVSALNKLLSVPLHVIVDSGGVSVTFPTIQQVSGSVAISGPVEIANDQGNPIPVSGTVGISGTVPVSGFPTSQPVTGPATDAQLRASPLPVVPTPTRGALVDRSGAIASAGATQPAIPAANPARTFLSVHNPSLTTDLYFNIGGSAAKGTGGSTRLLPGGTATYEGGFIPTGTVAVFGEKAGEPFTIKEG